MSVRSPSPGVHVPSEVVERLEANGTRATEALADRARSAGLDVVTEVREGYPTKDLPRYADDNDIDPIAMGTAGRRGIDRIPLGSTTARMVRSTRPGGQRERRRG